MAVLALAASSASPQVRLWPPCSSDAETPEPAATRVTRFNEHIQARFRSFDEFGLARVSRQTQHNTRELGFAAETEQEHLLLCRLDAERVDLAFYIAGRGVLGYSGKKPENKLYGPAHNATVSDPVRVSGAYENMELPQLATIAAIAKTTFREGGVEATADGWTLVGIATPASQDACVKCHNGENEEDVPRPMLFPDAPRLVVGDTIGVVVYIYRSK